MFILRRFYYCSFFMLFFMSEFAFGDTIPGGNVSGTWYESHSPYYITGDITLPEFDTLIIEPGVEVFLQGNTFYAYGYLEAIGMETDSIYLQGAHNIAIGYSNIPSQLSYCSIAGNEMRVGFSNPTFSHCRVENTIYNLFVMGAEVSLSDCVLRGAQYGVDMQSAAVVTMSGCVIENHTTSGIWMREGDSVWVSDCQFTGNVSDQGGGICAESGTVIALGCTFTDNLATNGPGGAINSTNASLTASECTFIGNICYSNIELCGGAIGLYDSDAEIDHSTFHGNNLALGGSSEGSAIGLYSSNATVDHCDFGCQDSIQIATVMVEFSNLSLSNSIFYDVNSWFGVFVAGPWSSMTLGYCNFFGILDEYVFGENAPGGVGDLVGVNVNGDSCDIYGNIFLDPLFTDPWNCDYTLQAGSPCIDAGDPAFALDPDSTFTDIGRYWYDQRMPDIDVPVSLIDFDSVTVGDSSSVPLKIYNTGDGELILYSLMNNLSVFTNDWNPADSIILPDDSLLLTITFSPDNSIYFIDTLWINNNDTLTYIELMGLGNPAGIADDFDNLDSPALELLGENPFSISRIRFTLPSPCRVEFSILDLTGRKIREIASGKFEKGTHEVTFDADKLSMGVYFCIMEAEERCIKKKFVILR